MLGVVVWVGWERQSILYSLSSPITMEKGGMREYVKEKKGAKEGMESRSKSKWEKERAQKISAQMADC